MSGNQVYHYDVIAKTTDSKELKFERVPFANPLHIGETVEVKLRCGDGNTHSNVNLGVILRITHSGSAVSVEERGSIAFTEGADYHSKLLNQYLDLYNKYKKF